jgi:hypothetical protein
VGEGGRGFQDKKKQRKACSQEAEREGVKEGEMKGTILKT